jgi:uncharacterized protein
MLNGMGVVGHSEGGLIGPMVAVAHPEVAFVVMLAGPAVPGDVILADQHTRIAQADNPSDRHTPSKLDDIEAHISGLAMQIAKKPTSDAVAKGEFASAMSAYRGSLFSPPNRMPITATNEEDQLFEAARAQGIDALLSPWMRNFLRSNPAPTLAKLKIPVLALWGSLDLQVSPQINEAAAKAAFKRNKRATIKVLPGLNHLFQTAKTGSPSEYATSAETISPVALAAVTEWISAQIVHSK